MAALEQQKRLQSGTEVRKGVCVGRGDFGWRSEEFPREQHYRKFENSTWDSHQKDVLWKKLALLKVSVFL